MTTEYNPCHLSDEQIEAVADEHCDHSGPNHIGGRYFTNKQLHKFARRLLSQAVPPVTATPSEAVNELVELAKLVKSAVEFRKLKDWQMMHLDISEAFEIAEASLAKHGTQVAMAAPPDDGAVACSSCGLSMAESRLLYSMKSATPSPSDLTAYGEKVREAAAKRLENGSFLHGKWFANDIRSMPLPAQSEGEEN